MTVQQQGWKQNDTTDRMWFCFSFQCFSCGEDSVIALIAMFIWKCYPLKKESSYVWVIWISTLIWWLEVKLCFVYNFIRNWNENVLYLENIENKLEIKMFMWNKNSVYYSSFIITCRILCYYFLLWKNLN